MKAACGDLGVSHILSLCFSRVCTMRMAAGYLSDVCAREECLEYMRRYMNRNVIESH